MMYPTDRGGCISTTAAGVERARLPTRILHSRRLNDLLQRVCAATIFLHFAAAGSDDQGHRDRGQRQ